MDARPDRAEVPLGATTLGLIAGIVAAGTAQTGSLALGVGALGCACRRTRIPALALLAGLLLSATPHAVRLPGVYEIHGTVRSVSRPFYGRVLVTLDVERMGGQPRRARVRIRSPVWVAGMWRKHTRLVAIVRLRGADGRGQWIGTLGDGRAVRSVVPPPESTGPLSSLRRAAAQTLTRALSNRHASLARAMILGDRSHVAPDDRTLFRETGQAHLLAVSGLHVGLWLVGLLFVLRVVGLGPQLQALTGLLTIAMYVPLTGSPPSAVRAGCAAGLYFAGRVIGRAPAPLVVLSTVALGIVIAQPRAVFEVAFQLSFGAVLGILVLTRPISAVLIAPRPVLPGFVAAPRALVRRSLAVSCAAWMGTLPFVAAAIGHAAPAGPLVAVVAIPLTALVLLTGMAVLVLGWIPGACEAVAPAADGALGLLCGVLDRARDLGVRTYAIGAPSTSIVLLYAASCAALARASTRQRAVWALLACIVFVTTWWWTTPATPSAAVHGYHPQSVTASLPLLPASDLQSPVAVAILLGCLLVVAALSVRLHWLSAGGAACALVLGLLTGWTFGAPGLGALFAPFLVATLLGKLPGAARAGARTPRQVLNNGIPAAVGCVLALLGQPLAGAAFFLGGLACLGSDSCATEVGVRYGGQPWSLTGAKVAPGESGGVTAAGTAAAAGGALLAPLGWCLFSTFDGAGPAVATAAAAGFAGSLLDSVLGSSLQYRGRVAGTDRIVEQVEVEGVATERVRGVRLLDNDIVNLVTGLAAGGAAVALWKLGLAGVLP